jgi:hypothetical protein
MADRTAGRLGQTDGHGVIRADEVPAKNVNPVDRDATAAGTIRVRGTMLWFNPEKDVGALRTADGECIDVPGTAFLPSEKPVGRCAGKLVEFETLHGPVARLAFVPEPNASRARLRSHRYSRR